MMHIKIKFILFKIYLLGNILKGPGKINKPLLL